MSILLTVQPKYMLAVLHAAQVTVSMPTGQTDRQTDRPLLVLFARHCQCNTVLAILDVMCVTGTTVQCQSNTNFTVMSFTVIKCLFNWGQFTETNHNFHQKSEQINILLLLLRLIISGWWQSIRRISAECNLQQKLQPIVETGHVFFHY